MTSTSQPCRAVTKSGEPCRNKAQHGHEYCYVHRHLVETADGRSQTSADAEPDSTPQLSAGAEGSTASAAHAKASARRTADYDMLIRELDSLIQELQRQIPATSSVAGLLARRIPTDDKSDEAGPSSATLELLVQLRDSILESTVQDLLDPETWKGFWLVTQVALQVQVDEAKARLNTRLGRSPRTSSNEESAEEAEENVRRRSR